ncbi:MAG: adenosylcobalamin-dependent ribonucleoside-diphosphate reductase [bacterium]
MKINKDVTLSEDALAVLKERYLLKDDCGNTIETPQELFQRVARAVGEAELQFTTEQRRDDREAKFFQMLTNLEFLPNSPTLMNAGTSIGQLSACFVLPVTDSLEAVFEALKNMAIIHKTGGGTGFDFSSLRPAGDIISTTKGLASGPVSFMSIFNKATDVVIQGGKRRGANMGILRYDHPDVFEFVNAKLKESEFSNFNLSVAVTDRFFDAVQRDDSFDLINPRTQKKVKAIKARDLFDRIVHAAWQCGDPGLIFIDEINLYNPTPDLGEIRATNPCAEVLLLPYESCILGSINVSRMIKNKVIDWSKLKKTIYLSVRFLDNVIEINKYPLARIEEITNKNRKIGLGVMGFADFLIKLGISYNEKKAEKLAQKLMRFIRLHSINASIELARERGAFPNIHYSIYKKQFQPRRNATLNAIAPTGTISVIAGCSSSIDPIFSINCPRNTLKGELFVTAFDIPPRQHVLIQAAFQKYTDNAVSKTVNLPSNADEEDVRDIFLLAHTLKCKGITVYRYGSKKNQPLTCGCDGKPFENLHTSAKGDFRGFI